MRKVLVLSSVLCMLCSMVWAQTRQITGRVLNNETGAAFAGASINVKGASKGAIADADGNFSISIPSKGTTILVVSAVGFASQEIVANSQSNLIIKLVTESKAMEDVVVIGYGSVKKKDLTGAVGSLGTADIVRANPTNATQALQGQVAGVVITKGSNLPGQAFAIDIRGENTINGITEPLVVIDGLIGGRLRDINPADIQSIDILKDASSTAIYGSRGANGVVIVTSKKGASGKMRLSVDSYVGRKTPAHLPELQNAQQFYKSMVTDWAVNLGTPITLSVNELSLVNSGGSTNWVNEITKPSTSTGNTIAVSGGNAGTTYRFSAGYIDEAGSIPHNNFKKYSINAAIDSRVNKFLHVGFTAYINYSTNPTGSLEALRSAYRARPTGVVYYKDLVDPTAGYDAGVGPWNGYAVWMGIKDNQVLNPLVEADPANGQFQTNIANQMGNAFAEITILKGLTFKTSFSGSIIGQKQGDYRGTFTKDRAAVNLPRATYSTADNVFWTFDNQLSYNYATKNGKHKISAIAATSAYRNTVENYSIAAQNLPFNSLWYNLGSSGLSNITAISSNYQLNTIQSYMGRVNYTFNDKYLFTLTGRSDGASQLAAGHKWAFFPSGAFAWRLGDEKFMSGIKNTVSDLKVRVSYGVVGNSTVAPYSTQASLLNTIYDFDQASANGFAPGALGNQDFQWEKSQEVNIGVNAGFLKNRITAAIEVYKRTTKDLILKENLPTSTGFSTVNANVGQISNKGIEIALNTRNIVTKDFTWSTSINFAKNINRIEALANGVNSIIGNSLFVGSPVKSYYDYKFAGIWQIADSVTAKGYGQAPGSVRVVDQNKDGAISSATGKDDRVVLGTQLPNYTVGMTNRLTYKSFDFSFLMYYRNGTLYNNGVLTGTMGDYTNTRYNHIVLDYWTRNNPINTWYGPGVSQPYKSAIQYEDASFLRVSDITLGYNLPNTQLNKWGMDRLRVYLQVSNPFIFTKYHGLDPEYNSSTYIDDVPTVIFTFGLNVGF